MSCTRANLAAQAWNAFSFKKDWPANFNPPRSCQFCVLIVNDYVFVLSMSDIKYLTDGILWKGKSLTSMWFLKKYIKQINGNVYHISVIEFTIFIGSHLLVE